MVWSKPLFLLTLLWQTKNFYIYLFEELLLANEGKVVIIKEDNSKSSVIDVLNGSQMSETHINFKYKQIEEIANQKKINLFECSEVSFLNLYFCTFPEALLHILNRV